MNAKAKVPEAPSASDVLADPAALVIRASGLTKRFGGLTAVDGLDLSVARGELYGLVGPDGAGKTTTMRLLTGIMNPSAGEAWTVGRHTVHESELLKDDIGYMAQRFGLYHDLTVEENLHFYADIYSVPARGREDSITRLLGFSGLTPFRKRLAGRLSGGMKQKLGLACALIHTPRVLFLDEPTNGVDPVSRRDFWRILYQLLRQDVTIFVSTAYLDEAERCGRVGLLDKGRLIAQGTPSEIKRLLHGQLLRLRTANARQTYSLLRERLSGCTVGLFGDKVHIAAPHPAQATADIERLLAEAGWPILELRPVEPSLEDVFVSVLAERDAASKSGQGSGHAH